MQQILFYNNYLLTTTYIHISILSISISNFCFYVLWSKFIRKFRNLKIESGSQEAWFCLVDLNLRIIISGSLIISPLEIRQQVYQVKVEDGLWNKPVSAKPKVSLISWSNVTSKRPGQVSSYLDQRKKCNFH